MTYLVALWHVLSAVGFILMIYHVVNSNIEKFVGFLICFVLAIDGLEQLIIAAKELQ